MEDQTMIDTNTSSAATSIPPVGQPLQQPGAGLDPSAIQQPILRPLLLHENPVDWSDFPIAVYISSFFYLNDFPDWPKVICECNPEKEEKPITKGMERSDQERFKSIEHLAVYESQSVWSKLLTLLDNFSKTYRDLINQDGLFNELLEFVTQVNKEHFCEECKKYSQLYSATIEKMGTQVYAGLRVQGGIPSANLLFSDVKIIPPGYLPPNQDMLPGIISYINDPQEEGSDKQLVFSKSALGQYKQLESQGSSNDSKKSGEGAQKESHSESTVMMGHLQQSASERFIKNLELQLAKTTGVSASQQRQFPKLSPHQEEEVWRFLGVTAINLCKPTISVQKEVSHNEPRTAIISLGSNENLQKVLNLLRIQGTAISDRLIVNYETDMKQPSKVVPTTIIIEMKKIWEMAPTQVKLASTSQSSSSHIIHLDEVKLESGSQPCSLKAYILTNPESEEEKAGALPQGKMSETPQELVKAEAHSLIPTVASIEPGVPLNVTVTEKIQILSVSPANLAEGEEPRQLQEPRHPEDVEK